MNSSQAKALLANLANLKIKSRAKKAFALYLQSIIDSDLARDTRAVIGRLPAVQQLNIASTTQGMTEFNNGLIERGGDRLADIPDNLFNDPDNEVIAEEL